MWAAGKRLISPVTQSPKQLAYDCLWASTLQIGPWSPAAPNTPISSSQLLPTGSALSAEHPPRGPSWGVEGVLVHAQ